MDEITASHHLVIIHPKDASPAASSHDAVEASQKKEPAAPPEFGCWCKVYLVILVLVALPFIPVALLIWCLYALLSKLTGSKGGSSPGTVAENEFSHNTVESLRETTPDSACGPVASPVFCSGRCSFILYAAAALLFLVVLIIWCPFWLLSKLLSIEGVSSPGKVAKNLNPNPSDNEINFKKKLRKIDGLVNEGVAAATWRLRILLLLLLSQVIVVYVPGWKRIKVLGWPLLIWMAMPALLIVVYHQISFRVRRIAKNWKEKAIVYYLDGLRRSGYWLIVCVAILLVWELHFRSPRHGHRLYEVSKKVHHIGTSLTISLIVGASLVLVKNWLILVWESHTIYRRCTTPKIREVGLQLYFLGLVYGCRFDLFSPDQADNINNSSPDNDKKELSNYVKKQMAERFIKIAEMFSREDITNGRIPKNIKKDWEKFQARGSDDENNYITKESVKKKLKDDKVSDKKSVKKKLKDDKSFENGIDVFFKKLRNEDESKDKKPKNADELKNKESKRTGKPKVKEIEDNEPKNADEPKEKMSKGQDSAASNKIPYEIFKEWMKNAFIDCVSFGFTLVDAQRAKNKLDIIITLFLVIVAVLCFLFLAGIASTKVLVTIWTSFAAAAFIFGDTLKAFFEGIIFVFVMNPFNVGDLCIIDDTQLEVSSIDVLKTTFHRIDNREKVLYPNKILAGKTISNLEWHSDNKDYVELRLRPPVGIDTLEEHIKGFVNEDPPEFEDPSVMTKQIGEFIKIAIHFKHIIKDDTHVRYFKKKNEQRSKLLKKVLDHIETKESSSTNNMVESSGQKTRETASSSTKNTTESSGQRTCETASSTTKNMAESLG